MPREFAPLAHVVWKTRAQQCTRQRRCGRNANPAPVQRGTLAAFASKHFVADRIVNHAQFETALALETNRNAEAGIAMRVVRGAIEWVSDPAPVTSAFAANWFTRA